MSTPPITLTGLVDLPGGSFQMGSSTGYPEEAPPRHVSVERFKLESHPVTNAQFARFIDETGYLTVAERAPDPARYPGVDPSLLIPGALVFTPTAGPVHLDDLSQWWQFVPGASWRLPEGPSGRVQAVEDRPDHPVVLVAYEDALAYARWCGRRLPTEAELEYAARAGRPGTTYAWGDSERPNGRLMANTWQGDFPYRNTGAAGWTGTSAVGAFPANPWGIVDLIGNVWEWTTTLYATGPLRVEADRRAAAVHHAEAEEPGEATCCTPRPDHLVRAATPPGEPLPRRVVKGGSHLCAPEYCHRYRPAARQGQTEDSATTHVGFRCAF